MQQKEKDKIILDTRTQFIHDKKNERYVTFCVCATILGLSSIIGIFWGRAGYMYVGIGILVLTVLFMWIGMNSIDNFHNRDD
jgi:hypothetical protein